MNLHSIFFQLFVFQIQLLPNTKTINLRVGKWAKRSGVSLFPRPRPPPRPGYIIKLALMGKSVKRVLSMQMKEWALPHHMSGNTILSFWKMASCPCTRTISEPRQALKKKKKVQLYNSNDLFEFLPCARHNTKNPTYIFSGNPHNNSMRLVPLLTWSYSWVLGSLRNGRRSPRE